MTKKIQKSYIIHFIETFNDTEIYGGYIVKELVQSIKENCFDWLTYLKPSSIDC